MDFFEAVEKRYSHRQPYSGQAVPRSDMERILQAGLKAPSGRNQQTSRFVVVDDPALLKRIAGLSEAKPVIQTAQAMIVCFIRRDPPPVYNGYSFAVEDCAAAVENMLLAITALGYASVWTDGWLRLDRRAEQIGELLGAPPDWVARVILPVGVPQQFGAQPVKKKLEERVSFNRWDLPPEA